MSTFQRDVWLLWHQRPKEDHPKDKCPHFDRVLEPYSLVPFGPKYIKKTSIYIESFFKQNYLLQITWRLDRQQECILLVVIEQNPISQICHIWNILVKYTYWIKCSCLNNTLKQLVIILFVEQNVLFNRRRKNPWSNQ